MIYLEETDTDMKNGLALTTISMAGAEQEDAAIF